MRDAHDSLDLDQVFLALAHPARRRILDVLKAEPGCSVADVCAHFEMSRIGVMKHLKVLERADLVISEKHGRTRELHFNVVPIQMIHDRWTTELSALWARRLTDLKHRVESQADDAEDPWKS
jgi:DNA-binding transcriptional ArsR family regulator